MAVNLALPSGLRFDRRISELVPRTEAGKGPLVKTAVKAINGLL